MKYLLRNILLVIGFSFAVISSKESLKAQGQMVCEWAPAVCEVIKTQCADGSYAETRIMGIKRIPFRQ